MTKMMLAIVAFAFSSVVGLQAQDVTGTWQGTLQAPNKALRTVIKISKDDGKLKSLFYSLDQGGQPFPVSKTTLTGTTVTLGVDVIGGTYEGKLSADGKTILGTFTQGPGTLPLNLTRATPDTEWALPAPPPRLKAMDPNATPKFDVATIKPSPPDSQAKGLRIQQQHFSVRNLTLSEMVSFAYGTHAKQLVGGPEWVEKDHYDIEAQPDAEGAPSSAQSMNMLKGLLADRFQLKFHTEKKELSVYVLTVGKTGPKLEKSESDPSNGPSLFFSALGTLPARNATMRQFADTMQGAVLDRPVVDQTGLQGKWNFTLKWTPDESQFAGMGMRVPPPSDKADAPPGLFTAIQDELGLKLEATRAPVDVMVVDKVAKPSGN